MTPSEISRIRIYGIYFGYPICCTEFFIVRLDNFLRGKPVDPYEGKPWMGTGFIPCELHQAQIEKEGLGKIAQTISANRACLIPFPEYET